MTQLALNNRSRIVATALRVGFLLLLALRVTPLAADWRDTGQLTLREAVQTAIANSPDAEVERMVAQEALAQVTTARGAFDFALRYDLTRTRSINPTASIFESPSGSLSTLVWQQRVSAGQVLPWNGLRYEVFFNGQRFSTTNPFLSLNPYSAPQLGFRFTLPLAAFRRTDEARTQLRVRRTLTRAANEDLEARLQDLATRVEGAYWQWVAAIGTVSAADQARILAEQALSTTERLAREGEIAQADVAGARGQLQRRLDALSAAQGTLAQAESTLRALLAGDSNVQDPIWTTPLRPAESEAESNLEPLADLVDTARRLRPELRAADSRTDAQNEQVALAREGLRPRVDLSFDYTGQGLAGREVDLGPLLPGLESGLPPGFRGGFGRGFGQIGANRFPVYQAGLSIELPVQNRAGRGRLSEATLAARRATLERRRLEIAVVREVHVAMQGVESARLRIAAADAAAQAAQARLDGELRLLREGQSNNLNVNVRQNELAESRQNVVEAWRAFNQSAADLRRATGRSLSAFGITVQ